MAFAGSPHRLGKHVYLYRAEAAVGLGDGRGSNEGSVAHVGQVPFFGHGDANVVRKLQFQRLAAA